MRELRGVALLGLCVVCACANHVRTVTEERVRESRQVLDSRISIERQQSLLDQPSLRVRLAIRETVERVREPVVTRVDESTPYEGAREFYEVPSGLVSLPISFLWNAFDVVLLGFIPNEIVEPYTAWTFAALNPALNTENAQRVARRESEPRTGDAIREREERSGPLARAPVWISFDGREPFALATDADGWLEFDLLEALSDRGLLTAPRRLVLVVRNEQGAEKLRHSLFVERSMAVRLQRALPLASLARSDRAEPDRRARALFALDRLGFREEAVRWLDEALAGLEDSAVAQDALRHRLDQLFLSPPSLDSVLESLPADGSLPANTP